MTRLVLFLTLTVFLFAGITWYALESSGVALVKTLDRQTHVWFVQTESELLLEAGNPNNPWVKDLAQVTMIQVKLNGNWATYRFQLSAGPASHTKIRTAMRDKYGWRDQWIALLFNVEQSALIRLIPVAPKL